jgi:hypothetical protein
MIAEETQKRIESFEASVGRHRRIAAHAAEEARNLL